MSLAIAQQSGHSDERGNWVPIKQAASLLGVTAGHLRRKCAGDYEERELARKIDGEWHLSPRLDERLRPVDPARRDREDAVDLAKHGIPARHIDRAESIRDLIANYNAFDCRGMTAQKAREAFLAHAEATGLLTDLGFDKRPGLRTFYTWQQKYTEGGLAALTRRQTDNAAAPAGYAAIKYIANLVNCGNRISINQAMTMAHAEAEKHPGDPGWTVPSYSKVRKEIAAERPATLRVITDKGERAARAQTIPHGRRDFEDLAVNDEWNGDECKLDVLHRVLTARGWQPRRSLVVTAWQDVRSRCIVGAVVAPYADSNTILGSIKCGLRDYGIPKILRTDWGKDYQKAVGTSLGKRFKDKGFRDFDGQRIASIFDRLKVEVRPVLPYRPQSKPIESFFRTLHSLFEKQFASYIAGGPEARHEDRMQWAKKNCEKLPTLDELCDLLPLALDAYHATPHSAVDMFGKTPCEALQAFAPDSVRRESDAVLDHLFLTFVGPKKVRRDGIKHNNHWYRHPENHQSQYLGQSVLLAVHPDDASRATVCRIDDDRTPLVEVECDSLRGFTQRDAKRIAQEQQRLLRPHREVAKTARKYFESVSPAERLRQQRAGAAKRYGTDLPDTSDRPMSETPTTLRLASDLEQAISNTNRINNNEASEAVRTGTDAVDITLDDMLADERRVYRRDEDDGLDTDAFFGFSDGEDA